MVVVMAKRRRFGRVRRYYGKARRRASKMTIPISMVAGLSGGMAGPIDLALKGQYYNAFRDVCINYTGFNPQVGGFTLANAKKGLYPLALGIVVHKLAGRAGVNRAMAAMKIPLIRI